MRMLTNTSLRLAGAAMITCTAVLAPAAALAAVSPEATATTASAPHLIGCNESSRVRPARFNPICNDGAGTVIRLHWPEWSGSAQGTGEFYTKTCVPSCAKGTVKLYDVSVSAWRVRSGDYTRLLYYFPHREPPGLSRSWTIEYYAHRWQGKVV